MIGTAPPMNGIPMFKKLSPSNASVGPVPAVPRPYDGTGITQVPSDAGPIWLDSADGVMLPYIKTFKTWEPEEGQFLKRLVHPGDVFVDVGGNVGYFVRFIARHCQPSAIHAFEPHPTSVRLLELNSWDLDVPVTIWPMALGAEKGTVVVSTAVNNVGDTRVSTAEDDVSATAVAVIGRMDSVISGRVDVVKVDVQGYESDVIRGMYRLWLQNPTIKLVIEFWPQAIRERGLSPESVLDEYRTAGFTIQLLQGAAPLNMGTPEIMRFCETAGPDGQVNLFLSRTADRL
jgi:FkbM family methyltransferase